MPNSLRPEDAHEEAEVLLPWYATGQLEPDERALVENHLKSCAECKRLWWSSSSGRGSSLTRVSDGGSSSGSGHRARALSALR